MINVSKSNIGQSFVKTSSKFKAVGMIASSRMELEIVPAACNFTWAQIWVVKPLTNKVSAIMNRIWARGWLYNDGWRVKRRSKMKERVGKVVKCVTNASRSSVNNIYISATMM
jgi:hypothetical protein